jgi:putative salt-induced outer membrane protein
MKKTLMAGALLAALLSFGAQADDAAPSTPPASNPADNGGWTGTGEFGFASAYGNTRSENINAKLGLNQENDMWKNNFFLTGLRSEADVKVVDANGNTTNQLTTTANRYDAGASVGFKLDPRSYIVTATRYEHDDFGANLWQGIVSVGYGYIALKTESTELSFEAGPGYKEYRPADLTEAVNGASVRVQQDTQSEAVGRGLVNYKYRLTDNTALENTLLIEAGSQNKYYQNDIGMSVSMTKKMALKLGYQVRYNSDVQQDTKHTDTLLTTNLLYNF